MLSRTLKLAVLIAGLLLPLPALAKLSVVVTCSSYEPIVEFIGGDHVEVTHLVEGYQDPHIVRPKPSLAVLLSEADMFVATGLDLEMWAPALVDQANNPKLRSGQAGYVAVSTGLHIAHAPTTLDRSEGDVHIFGNPHIHTSPLNGKVIAENITVGLKRLDSANAAEYDAKLAQFKNEVDVRLFGQQLVDLVGGKTLTKLAETGKLVTFLESQQYQGKPMSDFLGGWMQQALPLRGKKLVTFHENWTYFADLFGLEVVDYMEPKPGIPPSPGHIANLITQMQANDVKVMLAASYFDQTKVKLVADKAGATPVITGLSVGGTPEINTFFDQFDVWIASLLAAYQQVGQL
ncbi:MAG: metal ABC transporter substrate-binding protein [Pseudomonadota bacterium]